MPIQTLCVYCGASRGRRRDFTNAARNTARALADRGIRLVYGGGSVGLMGILADAALEAGAQVIGILPRHLHSKEIAHQGLTELIVVSSMHERKARMAEMSDGFIALPGGLGTLEEILEILTWAQLGLHGKPCGLLNVSGYYDLLGEFLDSTVTNRFVKPVHRAMLMMDNDINRLLDKFQSYRPRSARKWMEMQQT